MGGQAAGQWLPPQRSLRSFKCSSEERNKESRGKAPRQLILGLPSPPWGRERSQSG